MIIKFKGTIFSIKMKKSETYKLGRIKQLIDLNGDVTNFNLKFSVKSKDNSEFEAIVVDQNTLDNNQNIEYKKAPGTISGNIVADKNVYQNYFLLLKSEIPSECVVETELEIIEPNPQYTENYDEEQNYEEQNKQELNQNKQVLKSTNSKKMDYKKILILLVVIAGCIFIYYKFFKNKSKNNDGVLSLINSKNVSIAVSPKCTDKVCPTIEIPISNSPLETPKSCVKNINESLFEKLKSLPSIKNNL